MKEGGMVGKGSVEILEGALRRTQKRLDDWIGQAAAERVRWLRLKTRVEGVIGSHYHDAPAFRDALLEAIEAVPEPGEPEL